MAAQVSGGVGAPLQIYGSLSKSTTPSCVLSASGGSGCKGHAARKLGGQGSSRSALAMAGVTGGTPDGLAIVQEGDGVPLSPFMRSATWPGRQLSPFRAAATYPGSDRSWAASADEPEFPKRPTFGPGLLPPPFDLPRDLCRRLAGVTPGSSAQGFELRLRPCLQAFSALGPPAPRGAVSVACIALVSSIQALP